MSSSLFRARLCGVLLALTLGGQAAAAALPDRPIVREDLETFTDGVMAAQFAAHKLAGAAIVVVKDGGVVFEKGYGFADLERDVPVNPQETRFPVGSISKLFVWTAAMQLVEAGKLDLDADVNRYLLKFKIPSTYPTPITMRNLMTHTAGFEDKGAPFAPGIFRATPALGDFLAAHLPARVMPPARDFEHTTRPYSNWGALVAAYVVECVSHESFRDYVQQHILGPLGMSRSNFATSAAEQEAPGYVFENGAMVGHLEDMSSSGAAGGLISTASDISKFMIAQLGGATGTARILSDESLQRLHRRSAQWSSYLDGVALGFLDGDVNGRDVLSHDGSTRFTHSELILVPEANLGLFVVYNSVEGGYATRELRQAFMNRYFPASARPALPGAASPRSLQVYAGSYRSLRRSFTTFEKLLGSVPVTVRALRNGKLLVAGEQWASVAKDTFENRQGDRIAFGREHGRVTRLIFKSSLVPFARIHWYENPAYHGLALLLILGSAIGAIVAAIRGLRSPGATPSGVRRARWILAVIGLLNIIATGMLISALAGGIGLIMSAGIPTRLIAGLWIAMASAALTPVAVLLVALAWRDRGRQRRPMLWQTVHCAMAILFVALLAYWNLLGVRLG